MELKIAIVGLGRVGSEFMNQILMHKDKGINVLAAAEMSDTLGRKMAQEAGVPLKTDDEIVAMGEEVDIIFDLSGSADARKKLRESMESAGNRHTVIAPENVAYLLWSVMTQKALPDVHSHKGY